MTKQTVFITGADGFIGSHLTEVLVEAGYKVKALALYNSFNSWGWLDHCKPEVKNQFEILTGDIRDSHFIKRAMKGCDAVLHLAALIAIPYSYHSPDTYVATNIVGTINVLEAARELGISRLIHTSTSEVYGTARYVPINEDHPLQGQSPYSATKIASDQLVYSFYASFNLPAVIVRPFNTYGPRQSARAVIPTVITQIASGLHKIRLGATSPTRDFTFIKDTVAGFMAVLVSEKGLGEVVNLGSNFEISIGDVAHMIAEVMNTEIEIVNEDIRMRPTNSEVERLWADNSKALQLFNWKPKYSGHDGIRRGLAETAEWFMQPKNLSCYKSEIYNI